LAVGLGPGVVEEIWCRGFLGRGLTARYGLVLGVILTSIIFGLLHCSLTYAIPTACMGLYLHFVYLTSRSLWISILLHTLNNSAAIVATLINQDEQSASPVLYFASFSLVLFASIAMWTSRPQLVSDRSGQEVQNGATHSELDNYLGLSSLPHAPVSRMSSIALVFTLISFASVMYLLFC
jgi:hypothetical protein